MNNKCKECVHSSGPLVINQQDINGVICYKKSVDRINEKIERYWK